MEKVPSRFLEFLFLRPPWSALSKDEGGDQNFSPFVLTLKDCTSEEGLIPVRRKSWGWMLRLEGLEVCTNNLGGAPCAHSDGFRVLIRSLCMVRPPCTMGLIKGSARRFLPIYIEYIRIWIKVRLPSKNRWWTGKSHWPAGNLGLCYNLFWQSWRTEWWGILIDMPHLRSCWHICRRLCESFKRGPVDCHCRFITVKSLSSSSRG